MATIWIVIGTLIFMIAGGGIGFLVFIKTRPKKETWNAKIYQLGEGIREPKKDKNGNIIVNIKLQDLKPYAKDILERVEKGKGITVYRLQKLNKTTPAVEGDVVEYWGEKHKEVSVLMEKSGCTLMKKGYDKETGEMIFNPLPYSRVSLVKSELTIRKDRLAKEKDILQAITPWIVAGICMFGLVAITYITIQGMITVSENVEEGLARISESLPRTTATTQTATDTSNLGQQDNIPRVE